MEQSILHSRQKVFNQSTNFLITIHHQEHQSWQGLVQWLDTGKKVHFRSQLELMNLIQSAVQQSSPAKEDLHTWEDEHVLLSVK